MKIIKASNSEIKDIAILNSFVQKIHHDAHPDIFKQIENDSDVEELFEEIVKRQSNHLYVAYQNDTAVGYAWAEVNVRPEFALKFTMRQIYIHQIAVHPDYRKQSVGKTLFKEIENLAVLEGIDHMELDSWVFNTEAHKFFHKLDFETYNINMWKKN